MLNQRIAVIGGGVAGLTAAHLLRRRHQVVLFEKSARLGGNAYTHVTGDGDRLDIAAAAFGRVGYPNFYGLLAELGVGTNPCVTSYMSFHDLDSREGLYLTVNRRALLQGERTLLSPQTGWILGKLFVGLHRAMAGHRRGDYATTTIEACLDDVPELAAGTDARRILVCILCLLSSMDAAEVLAAPAAFFLDKLGVHNDVISPKAVYSVRCVEGGTQSYVRALAAPLGDAVVLGARIQTIVRRPDGVTLRFDGSGPREFDSVVLACNADQALALLAEPTADERRLLGAWRYKDGRVVVHRDLASFPARELIQAYTFLYTERDGVLRTSVNGAMWHEPQCSRHCPYVSSQHPNYPIRDELIELETVLRTPIFDARAVPTIAELPRLNGQRHTYFCGSHFGFGLHEDAVASAVNVAAQLGVLFVPRRWKTVAAELGLPRSLLRGLIRRDA